MTGLKTSRLVPKLRFLEFTDNDPWRAKSLFDLCDRLTEKVGDARLTPVSMSAGKGFVAQAEKFGRDISGSQYRRYIRLQRGDFAYNRGNSKRFPQGCVYQLLEFDEAAASTAFLCFRLREHCKPGFILGFFENNGHGRQLIRYITSSARSDGLLNINADTFFGITVPIPPTLVEQQKITDCLGSLDDLIAVEGRKLEALRQHKQGLMQQLFPQPGETVPRLRFPEFSNGSSWDGLTIGDVCDLKAGNFMPASEITEHADEDFFPCYGGNGLRGYVESFTHEGQYVVIGRQGALCGNVNLYAGKFHATEHAVVATPKSEIDTVWLFYALDVLKLNRFSIGQAQPGLSVGVLRDVNISVPVEGDEQQKIAGCLGSLDYLIIAEGRKLEALRQHKKGLLQQLFPSLNEQ